MFNCPTGLCTYDFACEVCDPPVELPKKIHTVHNQAMFHGMAMCLACGDKVHKALMTFGRCNLCIKENRAPRNWAPGEEN